MVQNRILIVWGILIFFFSSVSIAQETVVTLENEYVKYQIGVDGINRHFIDRKTGLDYVDPTQGYSCAWVKVSGQEKPVTQVTHEGDRLRFEFGESDIQAIVQVTTRKNCFLFKVVEVKGEGIEAFTFLDLSLRQPGEPFAGCALALNLQTNVPELPQANARVRALCYPRFGMVGAEMALIGCPQSELRAIMQDVVQQAPDLPHSTIGGPWALDAAINQGSYLFNFSDLSIDKVEEWIALANQLGINQIDFHGGTSFRFGDCEPNPTTYPEGRKSFKAVIDRLHAAGISAGLHTYAFFIDKKCPWVTPVPDPRLAKDATFTLAADLSEDATTVPVIESTQAMSAITGFFVRNSVTLQIDDELMTYQAIDSESPFAFTQCTRGAYGTTISAHTQGAQVHHLKECFGLFLPDGDSTLLTEVAECTARMFNECGFDMIYFDALDGEDTLGGVENGWHYGSKFVFEIARRLKKSALMEMSTFHHHLWYVRSRMGAWDHPTRGHKRFIDIHCQANESLQRMFLPAHLGWWAIKTWTGIQGEPTFSDDIEYLCAKCIGTDAGLSIMGINPSNCDKPIYQRLAGILKSYEDLRHAHYFDESVKEKLRIPGQDYTLRKDRADQWVFFPRNYDKQKVILSSDRSSKWISHNPYSAQPLKLRIEALMSVEHRKSLDRQSLLDFSQIDSSNELWKKRATAQGVELDIQIVEEPGTDPAHSGVFTVKNSGNPDPRGAWANLDIPFEPSLNLSQKQALGLWIKGDGQGAVLNVQLRSPEHMIGGLGERYIPLDFKGWRYIELVEMESDRYADYRWPYGSPYSIYRENLVFDHVSNLVLWMNNVPLEGEVKCQIGPIEAFPLVKGQIKNPTLYIGGKRIVFPVTLESGQYLEFYSLDDCVQYSEDGDRIGAVKPLGDIPLLETGENELRLSHEGESEVSIRTRITVITEGEAIGNKPKSDS